MQSIVQWVSHLELMPSHFRCHRAPSNGSIHTAPGHLAYSFGVRMMTPRFRGPSVSILGMLEMYVVEAQAARLFRQITQARLRGLNKLILDGDDSIR